MRLNFYLTDFTLKQKSKVLTLPPYKFKSDGSYQIFILKNI